MTDRRNFIGYRDGYPDIVWPNGGRLAVSFVVNVEEGAELSIADADERNESVYEAREEVIGIPDPCMESHYGYGPRVGYRRIIDALAQHDVPATFSCCGRAAARSPWLVRDVVSRGHEASCHGWRWERLAGMSEVEQRENIARTYEAVRDAAGVAPLGWHTRSASTPDTRRLLVEHGGFLYDSDAYDDDTPYLVSLAGTSHVVLPYAFDTNDMRFQPGGGFVQPEDFTRYCLSAFERLWQEGARIPRMLSIGLHLRIIGRPARIGALETLIDAMAARGDVWFATRAQIASHWRRECGLPDFLPRGGANGRA
ncbi:polysaccharide deacetylase family protein [Affinirhizobium pseudoryzae]|jgi:peptidoglycan/xylan/chitin deacetylase (PgdA/CDA1 family)|uniref:polysaccharide deacetylase family protein n=1 Tax=Allorhizobium pseudoryzae TaxID=379684 RepID=UPI0013EC8F9B|nr:polysaccharide deacetylase family protein [Allorhizobium pseudoryzae]